MIERLARTLLAVAFMAPIAISAQEHATPATPKPPVAVTPTATPTQVATAIAEALRTAEAAQAKRQAAAPRPASPRKPVATPPQRRYEVKWPVEHTVVQWPKPTSDRVRVAWPEALLPICE